MKSYFTQIKNELILDKNISAVEYRILNLLIAYSNNGLAFPSYRKISEKLGISKETTKRAINNLEKKDYILKENRIIGSGKKTSNCYYISEKVMIAKKDYLKEAKEEIKNIELFDYDWLEED